jgi:hypothetical protein
VLLPENRLVSVSQLWLPSVVSIQVTAVPALWPGHVCSPGDSGQAEDVGACPVGHVGAGNGGVHGVWVIASRGAPGSTGARPGMLAVCNAASTCARSPAPAGESGLSSRSDPWPRTSGPRACVASPPPPLGPSPALSPCARTTVPASDGSRCAAGWRAGAVCSVRSARESTARRSARRLATVAGSRSVIAPQCNLDHFRE